MYNDKAWPAPCLMSAPIPTLRMFCFSIDKYWITPTESPLCILDFISEVVHEIGKRSIIQISTKHSGYWAAAGFKDTELGV